MLHKFFSFIFSGFLLIGSIQSASSASSLPPQEQIFSQRLIDYLNRTVYLHEDCIEIRPDGSQSKATLWMDSSVAPGKMKMVYDPSSPIQRLLLAQNVLKIYEHDGAEHEYNVEYTPALVLVSKPFPLEKHPIRKIMHVGEDWDAFFDVGDFTVIIHVRVYKGTNLIQFLRGWTLIEESWKNLESTKEHAKKTMVMFQNPSVDSQDPTKLKGFFKGKTKLFDDFSAKI